MATAAWAANLKLYLKDGTYQIVREYQVQSDRVRYYSVQEGDWQEIPLDLVDLKRTQKEAAARQEQLEKDAKALSEEEAARRAIQKEVSRIPQNPGVYWLEGDRTQTLKAAESTVHTSKGRSVLQRISPVPMVPGKGTIEIQGAHSANVFTNPEQEFYIQLSDAEAFGIVRLTPKGGMRIVENLTMVQVTKETTEQFENVDIIQTELAPGGLYKIWPKEPLAPGEYAVVEYTPGKVNTQVWDFAVRK
jgi:hypothetical protein